jgi:hypothetical protein
MNCSELVGGRRGRSEYVRDFLGKAAQKATA